jgi:hypothetical protein
MPYRAAEYLCVRLGPRALRVASNLPQSGRLQESLEAELFWKQNSVLGRDVIVLSTPIRKGDHLISTWVRIRNDSRITGKLDVIGSSTGLVPTNVRALSGLPRKKKWGGARSCGRGSFDRVV